MRTPYLPGRIALDRATHALIKAIAREEGRTAYGVVREAVKVYDEWRKQAEDVIEDMEWRPKVKSHDAKR